MPFILAALGSLFSGLIASFGKLFTFDVLKFIAYKLIVLFVMFVALPIVLYNVGTSLIFDFLEYAMTYVAGLGMDSFVVQISGIGAYIATKIKLVESVTLFLSFVAIKFMFRFIPFLR